MIRLCDKDSYIVEVNAMSRLEMIQFFLDGHRYDVLQLVEEDMSRVGIVTYDDLIDETGVVRICTKEFVMSENFWEEARDFFRETELNLAPVYDVEGNILGFCYEDGEQYSEVGLALEVMEKTENVPVFIKDVYPKVGQVCIYECNEYAYRLYRILEKKGFQTCLIGEKWTWFGLETLKGIYDYPEYGKINVYAEGGWILRNGKEYEISRQSEIRAAFDFLIEIMEKNVRYVKQEFLKKFSNPGTFMYNVLLPEQKQLDFMTELEKRSVLTGDISELTRDFERCGKQKKEVFYEIYGKETLIKLYKKGTWTELDLKSEAEKRIGNRRRLYLLGSCIVGGYMVNKRESLPERLQQLVGNDIEVVPCFFPFVDFVRMKNILDELPIRQQDLLLFVEDDSEGDNSLIETFYLKEYYDDTKRGTWFGAVPIHTNALGNQKIAEIIYKDFLEKKLEMFEKTDEREFIQKGELLSEENREKVRIYLDGLDKFQKSSGEKTGAVVMNCNPFTYGHQYLIEYAAKKVDNLYVFVVEEDRSEFPFRERLQMVKEGTKHLANVKVNPSGRFILSYETLQIYFGKAEHQEEKVDAGNDLQIFARYIAPELGITCRFAGEEPADRITRQYNEQMKEILGIFGIEVCEIPRKAIDGSIISASRVRKALKKSDYETVQKMVPETTCRLLHIHTEQQ